MLFSHYAWYILVINFEHSLLFKAKRTFRQIICSEFVRNFYNQILRNQLILRNSIFKTNETGFYVKPSCALRKFTELKLYNNFFFPVTVPAIEKITEQETAHPSLHQLSHLTGSSSSNLENITVSHEIEERTIVEDDETESEVENEVSNVDSFDNTANASEEHQATVIQNIIQFFFYKEL